MGISTVLLDLLVDQLESKKIHGGQAITYGVQGVETNLQDTKDRIRSRGRDIIEIDPEDIKTDAITQFGQTAHQNTVLHWLGFHSVDSVDYYSDENPTIESDLNYPLDPSLYGKYDLVLDAGTSEHIFNVKESLFNALRLYYEHEEEQSHNAYEDAKATTKIFNGFRDVVNHRRTIDISNYK